MKRLFFLIPIILLVTLSLIYSCYKVKDESVDKVIELKNTDHLNFHGYNYEIYQENITSKNVVIIRVRLWRKIFNCEIQLGICDVKFFPKKVEGVNQLDTGREIDIPVTSSFDGGIVNIFFAQDVSGYTAEDLKLYVDGDIFAEDNNEIFESTFKVPGGIYMYDSTLGDFGGYSIPFVKIVN